MFGLKIFVQFQTCWQRPVVHSHNFCHPALSFASNFTAFHFYLLFCKLWDKCFDVFLVRIKMLVDLPIK